jgi:hypothetical protein
MAAGRAPLADAGVVRVRAGRGNRVAGAMLAKLYGRPEDESRLLGPRQPRCVTSSW